MVRRLSLALTPPRSRLRVSVRPLHSRRGWKRIALPIAEPAAVHGSMYTEAGKARPTKILLRKFGETMHPGRGLRAHIVHGRSPRSGSWLWGRQIPPGVVGDLRILREPGTIPRRTSPGQYSELYRRLAKRQCLRRPTGGCQRGRGGTRIWTWVKDSSYVLRHCLPYPYSLPLYGQHSQYYHPRRRQPYLLHRCNACRRGSYLDHILLPSSCPNSNPHRCNPIPRSFPCKYRRGHQLRSSRSKSAREIAATGHRGGEM